MPAGVRQGCALGLAMSKWRFANPQGGIGLGDRVRRLLDLRFADDILIFAYRKDKVQNVVDSLVDIWQRKGWYCTLRTTPSFIHIADRHLTKALRHTEQKRLDCMLCVCPGQNCEALVCSVRCWKWPCPHGCENGSRRIVP